MSEAVYQGDDINVQPLKPKKHYAEQLEFTFVKEIEATQWFAEVSGD